MSGEEPIELEVFFDARDSLDDKEKYEILNNENASGLLNA